MSDVSRHCRVATIVLASLAIFAGCSPKAPDRRNVTVAFRGVISSLDPIRENTVLSNSIYCNIFEPLVRRDRDMKIVPALAVSWLNPDDRTLVFTLRHGVRFHDGRSLRPQDVCFSLLRARDDPSSQISGSLTMLERVEAAGPDTVRVVTTRPYSILLNRLAEIWIVPEQPGATLPGTGPYRVKDWKAGQFVQLERNEEYWGEKAPVARIRFVAMPDPGRRMAELAAGRVDIAPFLEPSALESRRAAVNANWHSVPGMMVLYLAMDVGRKISPYVALPRNPFQDVRVRKAFYQAINIDAIVKNIMKGHASIATQLVAPKVIGYNDTISRLEYNTESARRLLEQAGYGHGFEVRFDITNNRYPNDVEIGQAVAADLAAVGIRARLNAVDKDRLLRMRDECDTSFYMAGWIDGNADAASAFEFLVHTRQPQLNYGTANGGGYSNPEVDRLIEQSSEEPVPSQRILMLESAMQRTMEDFVFVPLLVENNVTATSPAVEWKPRLDELIHCDTIRLK